MSLRESGIVAGYQPVILAGGFGTRTKEATEGRPKALIETDGRELLDYLLEDLESTGFKEAVLVSNGLFYEQLVSFLQKKEREIKVKIINNGVMKPEERLGALGDLWLGIKRAEVKEGDSWLVLASDYAYWRSFRIREMVEFAGKYPESLVVVGRKVKDRGEIAGRFGCLVVDDQDKTKVVELEEKPEEPKSDYAVIAFYVFRSNHLDSLQEFKNEGGNLDSPSNIVPYLLEKGEDVRLLVVDTNVVDAGTPEEIRKAKEYQGKK